MPIPRYQVFSPADAAQMSRLQLKARQVVEGVMTGMHRSPHKGFSVEFSEHRDYTPGDEIRHLDWRAYARTDRYYVKLFEQETNLRATIVIDTSNSMQFAGKLEYAKHLAACLSYLLAMQQDLAGITAIDEQISMEVPPASSPMHLDRLFRALETLQPKGVTNLAAQLHNICEKAPRRSMMILISDLWIEPADFMRALQHARYKRHELIVLHLLDQSELKLPFDRQVTVEDLETQERVQIDPEQIRDSYEKQVQEYLTAISKTCRDAKAEYHRMMMDVPYEKALVTLLSRRG